MAAKDPKDPTSPAATPAADTTPPAVVVAPVADTPPATDALAPLLAMVAHLPADQQLAALGRLLVAQVPALLPAPLDTAALDWTHSQAPTGLITATLRPPGERD